MDWAAENGIHLRFKAPRQKAWIVERHNEIWRRACHNTEAQLIREDIKVPFEQVAATVTFMKNSLTVIGNSTPYQGVLGRQPAMLPPLEGGHLGQVNSLARVETNSRFEARVREVAACNMIESHAKAIADRASRSNTRGCMESAGYSPRDLVEPPNKDQWHHPSSSLAL